MSDQYRFRQQREEMVARQIRARGIHDLAILKAMRTVPREVFVPERYHASAYDDTPLPIPAGQTISQPYVVALMIEALQVDDGDRVLEVGSGSGYAAALLSRIAAEVYAVERHMELVEYARERLQRLNYTNVHVHHSNGTKGWPPAAPYDAIMVSASGPEVPASLREQLTVGGRLVIPVGHERGLQKLLRVTRTGEKRYEEKDLGGVRFVPLIGDEGWGSGSQ